MKPASLTFLALLVAANIVSANIGGLPQVSAQEASPAEGVAYFEKHIRPLFAKHCYSCHSAKRQEREGGLVLDRRVGLESGGVSGPMIVPGDVRASLLIAAVRYDDPDLQMPPDSRLAPGSIEKLERWVRMGAPWPVDHVSQAEEEWSDPSDPAAGRSHWAFQPIGWAQAAEVEAAEVEAAEVEAAEVEAAEVEAAEVEAAEVEAAEVEAAEVEAAEVEAADWPRSPLDTFVLRRLEAEQLTPVAAADRRALLRRASILTIGLPPDGDVLAEFLTDTRPAAYNRQVERLLASPHFGEQWGRHWLDLARYADSNGLDENFLFREAWRYRNRVIAAMNADMPFDRFLEEQIAGDLLPFDSIEQRDRQRLSAGFLVVGPKVLLGNNPEERVMDVADEQLDTIGRAVLGQTLGCARCHDHKFDPIPTDDYYALAGIMTSTSVMQKRYMLGQQRTMERLVGLGRDGDALNEAYEVYWRELASVKERHKHAQSALELLLADNKESELADLAEAHPKAVAEVALDVRVSVERRRQAQRQRVDQLFAITLTPPSIPPRAMIPTDDAEPSDEAVRLAGQFDRKGNVVPRGFLRVLQHEPVAIPKDQSGRLRLARWLTDADCGAGNLAARVLANRIWHHLIGRGIVRTVDNFGRTGEAPSHPQLLDYLAGRLVDSGWSIKALVREILLSRTFMQSSRFDADAYAVDPENRLLWRAHRRRLSPEALRDAMLHAAGTLDLQPLDSAVSYLGDQATAVGGNKNRRRTNFPNRSIYLPVIRNDLPEIFEAFDFADPHSATGLRPDTLVPMQGLFLMNDEAVMQAAESTARRVLLRESEDGRRVDLMYQLILNADVGAVERKEMLSFVSRIENASASDGPDDAERRAWSAACHALFASSRFQILE